MELRSSQGSGFSPPTRLPGTPNKNVSECVNGHITDNGPQGPARRSAWAAHPRPERGRPTTGPPRLREPDRFAPWLFTIARRSVTDRLRGEYARERESFTTDEPMVEDPVEAMVDRAELVAALAGLPVLEREILVLFYLEDLSVEECAQICLVPAGTVKSRLNRARRMLREHLEERGYGT
ncbi:RNA polymerase sigma factor [Nonomuraea jabiensis]|uniref:RNA polymerase sigma factor n=1 Tax=Nonomuraea jabiensis TaxID=882448 RepID=UPI0036983300